MEKNLTCIVCPLGCQMTVTLDGGRVLSVTGNTCKRGAAYAEKECTSPVRTVTSTVRAADGSCMIPVKTNAELPKEKIPLCMEEINRCRATLPVHRGDILIRGVAGTECDVIATRDME